MAHASVNGIWFIFLGWFLLTAARQSYAQIETQGALQGLRAADVMTSEMPTVGRDLSLEERLYIRRNMATLVGKREATLDYFTEVVGNTIGVRDAVPAD